MQIAMVTLWDGESYEELAALVNPGKQSYCNRFGYDFVCFDESLDRGRPASWSKVLAIKRVLADYDWVIWSDVDTVLWDPGIGLRQFVSTESCNLVIQENHQGLNSGVFLLRNCQWSHDFLDAVYAQEQLTEHPWWEQQAIIELREQPEWGDQYHVFGPGEPHLGFHGYFVFREWEKLLLHFAGMRGDLRRRLIENTVRLSHYPPHLRIYQREGFAGLFNRLGLVGQGAEVGVERGNFSRHLLDHWEGEKLHLIDAWRHLDGYQDICNLSDEGHAIAYEQCLESLSRHVGRYEIHQQLSADAAECFADESLDFVYLDANHSHESSGHDIRVWWPKVRPGGVLCGHDFLDGQLEQGDFGVRSAVCDFEIAEKIVVAVTLEEHWPSWYVIKPDANSNAIWT